VTTSPSDLVPFDADGNLQVVVESPRGSTLKFEYDVAQRLFQVARALPV